MEYYVDPNIKNTERVFPMQGREDFLRLDMNENPEGLPADFVEEVKKEITPSFLSRYPEPERFRKKYAEYLGAAPEQIFVANGTDQVIRYALWTFGEKGKEVLTVTPSFEMYRINCMLLGLVHKAVPYEPDLTIDVTKILSAISEETRVVVLVNPNNPVGNVYSKEDFSAILKRASEVNAVVFVDEAYHYFCETTELPFALSEENVLVFRTFSKLFSIPALRLGAAIGNEKLIRYLKSGQLSFDVNAVALLFGERLLDRQDLIDRLIRAEREGKKWLADRLTEAGYEFIPCQGNYLLIKTKKNPKDTEKTLFTHKILVHTYGNPALSDYLRVTTASVTAMKRFYEAFSEAEAL